MASSSSGVLSKVQASIKSALGQAGVGREDTPDDVLASLVLFDAARNVHVLAPTVSAVEAAAAAEAAKKAEEEAEKVAQEAAKTRLKFLQDFFKAIWSGKDISSYVTDDAVFAPPGAELPMAAFADMCKAYKQAWPSWECKVWDVVDNKDGTADTLPTWTVHTQQVVGKMTGDVAEIGPFPAVGIGDAPAEAKSIACVLPTEIGQYTFAADGKLQKAVYAGELGDERGATTMHITPPAGMGCLYQWIGVPLDQLPPPPPQTPGTRSSRPAAAAADGLAAAAPAPLLPDGQLNESNLKDAWEHAANLCAEKHQAPHENVGYGPVMNRIAEYITTVCPALPRTREHHVTILIVSGGSDGIHVDQTDDWHVRLKEHIDALASRRVFVQTAVLGVDGDDGAGCNGGDVFNASELTFDPALRLVEHVTCVSPATTTTHQPADENADAAAAAAAPPAAASTLASALAPASAETAAAAPHADAVNSSVETSATTNTNAIETVEEAMGRLTQRFAEAACYWPMRVSIGREGQETLDCHITASATRPKEFGFGSAMAGFDEEDPMVFTAKAYFRDVLGDQPTGGGDDSPGGAGGALSTVPAGEVALTAFDHDGAMISGGGSGVVPASVTRFSFGSMLQSDAAGSGGSDGQADRRCFAAHHDLFRTYVKALASGWSKGSNPRPTRSVVQPTTATVTPSAAAATVAAADVPSAPAPAPTPAPAGPASEAGDAAGAAGATPSSAADQSLPAASDAQPAPPDVGAPSPGAVPSPPEKGSLGEKIKFFLNYLTDLESRPHVLHHAATDMKTGLTQFGYALAQLHGASNKLAQLADEWCQSEGLGSSAGAAMLMQLGRSAAKELCDSNFEYERQRHNEVEKQRGLWEARPAKGEHKKVGSSGIGRKEDHDYKTNKTPDFAFRLEMFSNLHGESSDGGSTAGSKGARAASTDSKPASVVVDISALKDRDIRAYLKEHGLDQGGKTSDKRKRLADFVAGGGVLKPTAGALAAAAAAKANANGTTAAAAGQGVEQGSGGTLAPPKETRDERADRKEKEAAETAAAKAKYDAENKFDDEMEEWGFGATPQPQQWLRAKSNVKLSEVSEHHPIIQSARLEQARAEAIAAERAVAEKHVAEQQAAEEASRREEEATALEYAETLEKVRLAAEAKVAEKKKAKKSLVLSRWGREEQVDIVPTRPTASKSGRSGRGSGGHRRNPSMASTPFAPPTAIVSKPLPSQSGSGKEILEVKQTLPQTAECGGCKVGDKVEVMNKFPGGSVLVRNVKKVWEVRHHKSKMLPPHAFQERPPTPEVEFASFGSSSSSSSSSSAAAAAISNTAGRHQHNSAGAQNEPSSWWHKGKEERTRSAEQQRGAASSNSSDPSRSQRPPAMVQPSLSPSPPPPAAASSAPFSSPPAARSNAASPPTVAAAPPGLKGQALMDFNTAESEKIAAAEGRDMTREERLGLGSASTKDTQRRLNNMTFNFSFGSN